MVTSVRTDHAQMDSLAERQFAIVAGGGEIPIIVAEHVAKIGKAPFIIMLKNDADPALKKYEHMTASTAAIGQLISTLKSKNIADIVFVGSVKGRPRWSDFRPDLTTLKFIGHIVAGLRDGDNGLLSRVVSGFEQEGIRVHGAHEVMSELLTAKGPIVGDKPKPKMMDSINLGIKAARRLGELDAGQGCVVIGQRIVALEGVEGTDAMIARVADLRAQGKLPDKRGGVLVKMCKPQQDRRVDMPTIGIKTVENAIAAQLEGIAIDAGNAMIVDLPKVIEAATGGKLFIYGVWLPNAETS